MATIKLQQDELADVREQLNAWGAWLRSVEVCRLGYPSKANFVVVPSQGCVGFDLDRAEIIEEVLVQLKKERHCNFNGHFIFKVIQQDYYFENSSREGAERLNLTRMKYRNMKLQGEAFVLATLLTIKNIECYKNIA